MWRHLRMSMGTAGDDVQLFLGSRTGSSQLVTLPTHLLQRERSSTEQPAAATSGNSEPISTVVVQKPAMIDSSAPIHDAFVFQEPKGVSEATILRCYA